jgi:hypothetical protein
MFFVNGQGPPCEHQLGCAITSMKLKRTATGNPGWRTTSVSPSSTRIRKDFFYEIVKPLDECPRTFVDPECVEMLTADHLAFYSPGVGG